ncbi:MAG: dimethyl sulfoxide reductase anchor subunit [Rhodobacteraceae bacterium]|nr:dimethyl sulfoxide reductase anchor subunit [Paracoccaceae bacterium]
MHPAPSVIIFTVLSGAGFGLLFFLALGAAPVFGLAALLLWGTGYALAVIGLLASTFHLGNPQRALRAFTQWRTSWLSREGWASVGALLLLVPVALAAIAGGALPPVFGLVGAAFCLATVAATSMIYAQLKTVPRWNYWTTPALFLAFAATAGAILTGRNLPAAILSAALGVVLVLSFRLGDGRFARRGASLGTATGLGRLGAPRVLAPAHTSSNYLMKEMIHVVGRKHSRRLRWIAVIFASVLPLLIMLFVPPVPPVVAVAALLHLAGAFVARWLFFAEAEHVVGLYYGQRGPEGGTAGGG